MDSDEECDAAILIVFLKKKRKWKKKKRLRTLWIKPWLTRRNNLGVDNTLLPRFLIRK